MSHYYDENPEVESDESLFTYSYDNHDLELVTDAGVFSKGKIDFGSDLLVKTFLKTYPPGPTKNIIDVGCGYGPIGLMIAKVSPHHEVTMVDVNQRALNLSRKNKKRNRIDNVKVKESDGLSQVEDNTYDFVLTNPPIRAGKEVVHRILEDAYVKLKLDGELFVVIQKKQGMPSAKKKMQDTFDNVEVLEKSKGYYILRSVKG
ncbi:class I SAM-dependent methyltransferase [Staphylococcus pseudoxylosus]|uniref:class I SAM-dependent methyltransferase n=1 Tax=Staphylococcus pseudoxylosus TaxID=2282419 RepID=UPI000D1DF609|nr:class I SAM-dependent methyltransferase [Staphylococcus pseudoxylosus]PTI58065.1 class I SAM-dependent methyltransferase [Staphylococcus xylosus]MDW8796962.1 class I SAM-dependent methyltransferase [Staphylococcus pseudoxylosus]MEB6038142.1 class I SAM-dependent methyltransferase [Staphylococcus pseudoxylosus]MEB6045521.1 class I SAM-dependent methyltransferase [Staphylococcus pseudoxylosus]MEB6061854.1 class I SAM-dependent methyltransferase [Staphylococcus pseudoxylosus]